MRFAEKEDSTRCWNSSTNWISADGSLEDSISFENSSAEDGEMIPIGVLLERPADSPPCEITVSFKEKHELHNIYVRSSARVFEVYYASDCGLSSNEYLCTVRCGAAQQGVTEDTCERVLADVMVSNVINADFPGSNSNNVTEDGWVEVQAPDSLGTDNTSSMSNISVKNISSKTQIHYEATAEISDSSPCMSITLRLLSLQVKTFVHIDEIYIYADPVEDTGPDPSVSNVGTGSLLSMLVPSLLQLSKPGISRLRDKGFPDALAGPKNAFSAEGTLHAACPDKLEMSKVEASSTTEDSKVYLDQLYNEKKLEHPIMASSKLASDPHQGSKFQTDENDGVCASVENLLDESVVMHTQSKPGDIKLMLTEEEKGSDQSHLAVNNETSGPVRLEKILDDLVSRMGKLENFCSSFQESILKPLTGIETRLQRIEEQLDAISKVPPSPETYPSTWTSRFSAHDSSLENEGSKSSSAGVDCSSHEKEASIDLLMVSSHEDEKISGLVVKAPEFLDDDDDDDVDESNIICSVDFTPKECPKNGKCLPVDNALASALAAFAASTTNKSSLNNSHPTDMPNEQQNSDKHFLDSASLPVHSDADKYSVFKWFSEDKNGDYENQDEMCQSEKTSSVVVDLHSRLNKVVMFDRTGTKGQGICLSDESLLVDDDLSAEIKIHESKCLIIRAPEFPAEDDILDCSENSEPHVTTFSNAHSHGLPYFLPTLALFLSSRKVSPMSSLNSHDDPSELSTSERSILSSTKCQVQGGSDGMCPSSLENYVNTPAESSLISCFLSQCGSPQQEDVFHDTPVIGEGNSCFMHHSLENGNHGLKFDGFHSNDISKSCTITQNLLPCNALPADRSTICIQDEECCVSDSEERATEALISDLLGKFEAAEDITSSSFHEISLWSKPHPEYSDSNLMDSVIPAFVVTGQNGRQTTGNSGRFEILVHCESRDSSSVMKSHFEPEQMSNFVPGQSELTSSVEFCADKNLSWLPLEILLDEKQDGDPKDDQLKPVQQRFVSDLELSVDRNLIKLPLDGNSDEMENVEYNKLHNEPPALGFNLNYEIGDNTILDVEDSVVQSEISCMVSADALNCPVFFSSGNLFPSLI